MVLVELPADLEFGCEVVGVACILDCSLMRFSGAAQPDLYRSGSSSPGPPAGAEDNLQEDPSAWTTTPRIRLSDHQQEDPSAGVEDDLDNDAKDTTARPSTGGPLCWSGG
ncbi:uncharacterized protein LOC101854060 [Aplysia californica]|uniref:Uncharacterized protein LOC101854060 n=1 Tax=Aplysia californica TaxID=6500 RepID=A0ABM1AD26_APLCA|nr:uncharacterized protein LOC101854060 [Aplysia californica]